MNKSLSTFQRLVLYVCNQVPDILVTELAKTLYLIEYEYYKEFGIRLSNVGYVRIIWGPVPDGYKEHFKSLNDLGLLDVKMNPGLPGLRYNSKRCPRFTSIEEELFDAILDDVFLVKLGHNSWKSIDIIKDKAYNTVPMQRLAEIEKENGGRKMIGAKVLEPPFFDPSGDVEEEAELDRLYMEHLKKCSPIDDEDREIDEETFQWVRRLAVDGDDEE